jgi:dTDP-4-dehydrorhamnose reductase
MELAGLSCRIQPIETKDYPTPAIRPPYSVLNKSKIKETCKLTIPHWEESLKAMMKVLTFK